MKLLNLFKRIESSEFSAYIGVANGFRVFQRALEENDILKQLIEDVKKVPAHRQKIIDRVALLLKSEGSMDIDHPYDAALAAYLFALSKADSPLAYSVATKFEQISNLWWAKRLANAILVTMQTAAIDAAVQIGEFPMRPTLHIIVNATSRFASVSEQYYVAEVSINSTNAQSEKIEARAS